MVSTTKRPRKSNNPSLSSKIRKMLDEGHTNKEIIDRLKCDPRMVYNLRYQVNKRKGLAAIPGTGLTKKAPKRRVRAVKATPEQVTAFNGATLPYGLTTPTNATNLPTNYHLSFWQRLKLALRRWWFGF